jgi:hypothetical protein
MYYAFSPMIHDDQGELSIKADLMSFLHVKKKPSNLIFKAARLSIEIRSFPSLSHGRFGFVSRQVQWMLLSYFMTNLKGKQWHGVVHILREKRNSTGALPKDL